MWVWMSLYEIELPSDAVQFLVEDIDNNIWFYAQTDQAVKAEQTPNMVKAMGELGYMCSALIYIPE